MDFRAADHPRTLLRTIVHGIASIPGHDEIVERSLYGRNGLTSSVYSSNDGSSIAISTAASMERKSSA